MSYWSAKSDLEFMLAFRDDVREKWALEDKFANWRHPNPRYLGQPPRVEDDAAYIEIRDRIGAHMNRAEAVARRHAVGHSMSIVLRDWGPVPPNRQNMMDGINRTVGAVEEEVREERKHIWNPLWWLLHGPFMLLRSAGMNTDKVEQRLWSRLLVQLTVDIVVGVIAALMLVALGVGR